MGAFRDAHPFEAYQWFRIFRYVESFELLYFYHESDSTYFLFSTQDQEVSVASTINRGHRLCDSCRLRVPADQSLAAGSLRAFRAVDDLVVMDIPRESRWEVQGL